MFRNRSGYAVAVACAALFTAVGARAAYDQPSKPILAALHAPLPPTPSLSPTHADILLVSRLAYPSIARVAEPYLRLAGVRVEPRNHSKHDTPGGYGVTPCMIGYELVHVADGKRTPVALPEHACAGMPRWSADGKRFAFVNLATDAVQLWIGDTRTGTVKQVPGARLNPMFNDEMQWMPDQASLLVKLVPDALGAPPPEPAVPPGPSIQESDGKAGRSSTYEVRDTLKNAHDEDLFDYYASSQLALVDAATLAIAPLGKPANFLSLQAAPDGKHLLVETIHKPYSYIVTYSRFPKSVQVWDVGDRAHVAVKQIADLPLADRVPIHGVPTGPRDFDWRATDPATLTWAEALDGGDWNATVPKRDKVLMQRAPFDAPPVEIARTDQRYTGIEWTQRPDVALLGEYDENRHWTRTFIVDVDDAARAPRLLWDMSSDEKYANPGMPVTRELANGVRVVQIDGDAMYLDGAGASPDGIRPFLDRLDLKTLKTERLFRSDKSALETFIAFAGDGTQQFLTWHQTPTDVPNVWVRTRGKPIAAAAGEAAFSSSASALTHSPDPLPAVRGIKKRLVKYKRADGLDLSFTLMTPPGYKKGTRLPAILYAYPLDYANAAQAGQVAGTQNNFTWLRQHQLLLLAGYAIIDNASFPIVGDPKSAYDTYLPQLLADAKAAVDKAVELGVVDRDRIGVTGHSHGALMTANLVAHSDLFRAGIATSGAYDKVLTPFGFQNERRSVWQATDVYLKVSPFFSADTIKIPLLLVHGADDANPGTTPMQSETFYEAIRGNGGTTRLVMLPHEPHWYSAMESQEQLAYEMQRWFDKYVKDAKPRSGN
jgi:dipeptidyl aminopeptidase/acylaminoacyl peptidase